MEHVHVLELVEKHDNDYARHQQHQMSHIVIQFTIIRPDTDRKPYPTVREPKNP